MAKQTFQSRTTKRILEAAPQLKFVAFYHGDEDGLNACMRGYGDRSFVYIISTCYEGEEYFLYVGKSKAQYARCLAHSRKFAYEQIYLFECAPAKLADCEKAVIRELTPLFNRQHNPEAARFGQLLEIDYDAVQDQESIERYLRRYSNYKKMGLFGFALPVVLYTALEEAATETGCSCGELVFQILENQLLRYGKMDLDHVLDMETNLVSAEGYGDIHSRSQEQVKQYLHQKGRMPGTVKIGRDWIIPIDMKFPEDRRGKRREKTSDGNDINGEVSADGEGDYQQ